MKTDLINIFNRLTSSELADYNIFSDIIENHYEKYKYLYTLIENINLKKVSQIYCTTNKNTLRTIVEPEEVKYLNDIITKINKNRNKYTYSKEMTLDIIETQNYILIEISTKNNKNEGTIYDSRFV